MGNKFWLFVGVSVSIIGISIITIGCLFWQNITLNEQVIVIKMLKQYVGYYFGVVFLSLAALGFALDGVFHNYIIPLKKMIEETTLIQTVNPYHRLDIEGSGDVVMLSQNINDMADHIQKKEEGVKEKIEAAKMEVEAEKNILATFMGELHEGILIVNKDGSLIFYNNRAVQFLEEGFEKSVSAIELGRDNLHTIIGLGRSVYQLFDKQTLDFFLEEILYKIEKDEDRLLEQFVVMGRENRLLNIEMVPVLTTERLFSGYVLIINDISEELEKERMLESGIREAVTKSRCALSNIISTTELIIDYPDLSEKEQNDFYYIILNNSDLLNSLIDKTQRITSRYITTIWPRVPMKLRDLKKLIVLNAYKKSGIRINAYETDDDCFVSVDSYSITWIFIFILHLLKSPERSFTIENKKEERFVTIDLFWNGKPLQVESLIKWEERFIRVDDEGIPLSVRDIVSHHGAEIWSAQSEKDPGKSYLRLLLPISFESKEPEKRSPTIIPMERPMFYDFDLFNQPGQTPEIDRRPLNELIYTVFDTETTGLDPRGGDEIISIGAARIVNMRLLKGEYFDRLINPKRPIPYESVKIHHITNEMVKNSPDIETVLPLFRHFSGDSVLVAHNAAFDMRMLKLYEKKCGVSFINPVLDTLLLSSVVHPSQKDHSIEGIAKRLGIDVIERHSALGDAITTGQIFLKLIPLLFNKGIYTLKEARIYSEKTYYAKLKY